MFAKEKQWEWNDAIQTDIQIITKSPDVKTSQATQTTKGIALSWGMNKMPMSIEVLAHVLAGKEWQKGVINLEYRETRSMALRHKDSEFF